MLREDTLCATPQAVAILQATTRLRPPQGLRGPCLARVAGVAHVTFPSTAGQSKSSPRAPRAPPPNLVLLQPNIV